MRRQLRRTIALTTDFGIVDNYVGVLKGVILSVNPSAVLVDICHALPPHDIATAAYTLGTAWRYFSSDTIHVVVVDPGVGGERSAIALSSPGGVFLSPDNGVLTSVIRDQSPGLPVEGGILATTQLSQFLRVRRLTNPSYWLPQVSDTFHGRDIFAPVAAHLSNGVSFEALGEPQDTVFLLPTTVPTRGPNGNFVAHVIHIDRFGNVITDLTAEQAVSAGPKLLFRLRGRALPGLFRNYAEGPALKAIVGSGGFVEIALRNGDAAALTGAQVGDEMAVTGQS
ncbi:MAG: SAM-dependent chlorinase/fluorinase [Chloroflexi bacterium]|nr:SAM-dependent chlorinase/fluorinase [Chloroflexota bacterium]